MKLKVGKEYKLGKRKVTIMEFSEPLDGQTHALVASKKGVGWVKVSKLRRKHERNS